MFARRFSTFRMDRRREKRYTGKSDKFTDKAINICAILSKNELPVLYIDNPTA